MKNYSISIEADNITDFANKATRVGDDVFSHFTYDFHTEMEVDQSIDLYGDGSVIVTRHA